MRLAELLFLIEESTVTTLWFGSTCVDCEACEGLRSVLSPDALGSNVTRVYISGETGGIAIECAIRDEQDSDDTKDICKQNAIVGDSKTICGDCQMYNGEHCAYKDIDIAESTDACDGFKPCKGFNGHTCEDCYKYDKYHYWCKYDKHHVDETTPACKNFTI